MNIETQSYDNMTKTTSKNVETLKAKIKSN